MTDMRKALEEARAVIAESIGSITYEVNEKGAGGDLLARLSDLRTSLTRIDAALAAPGGEPCACRYRASKHEATWVFEDAAGDNVNVAAVRDAGLVVEPLYRHPEAGEREGAAPDLTWFWEIVDRDGLGDVPSDERGALARLVEFARQREEVRSAARDFIDMFIDVGALLVPPWFDDNRDEFVERFDALSTALRNTGAWSASPTGEKEPGK